ncbi:M1 family metallopeptidase [Streptomyces sp. L2]|uniref:M1 family metallopeptidase n=1 Tax=Streptomyces sp. L2 TaxID=2162665 RepID=UPI0010118404|nr:M1 family metallopeptidase [Streptomyces sp. L2]
MSRPTRRFPARLAVVLALALTGTACGGSGGGGVVHATPGSAGVHDPYFPKAGNGGYDVSHYALTLDYTPDTRRLTGRAVITARATQDLSAFDLDLAGLHVDSVTVEGRKAAFSRAGQELTVRPHDALAKGETYRTTVRYSGVPRTLTDPDDSEEGWLPTADGAVGLGEPVGSMAWFPCDNHPSDKATYDLTVTVPEGLQAVSNGELTEQHTEHGRTAYTWHTPQPMASYLATVDIGHFTISRTTGPHGLPIVSAVDPTQAEAGKKAVAKISDIIGWEEYNFGPFPFSSTGAIIDRPHDSGFALETQNRPFFHGAPDTAHLVHELAHEWYGDSVTPKSWRDMWLNEGFATYAEWLYDEDHGGDTAQQIFMDYYKGDDESIWAFPPAKPSSAAHISDSPVYERGAMVLHKIRQKVGDDTFYDIIQGWAAAHRHGTASTADFTAYVEKAAPGKDFKEIWKDWLYGDGKPDHP